MKKNLTLLAAALVLAGLALAPVKAHSTVLTSRVNHIVKLPGVIIPTITIKREILLPTPVIKHTVAPTLTLSTSKAVIAVPLNNKIGEQVVVKILPQVPVVLPGKSNGISIKKFGAFFDGAKKEEAAPAVIVPQTTEKTVVVPQKIEELITKDRSYTLPERTLEDEIGI